ncbi:cytochrome P450 4V2-like [Haemaphysalis longicornis]
MSSSGHLLNYLRPCGALLASVPWASVFITLFVIAVFSHRWLRRWIHLRSIPGPGTDWLPPWFLLSLYWEHAKHLRSRDATTVVQRVINRAAKMYEGKTYKIYLGMTPFVMLHTPEAVQVLLTSRKNLKRPFVYYFLDSWFGKENILSSEGDAWRKKARLFKAGFTTEHRELCMDIFNRNSKIFLERVEAIASESLQTEKDCYEMAHSCVMDNVSQAILGENLELQRGKNQHYRVGFNSMTWLLLARIIRPWAWFLPVYYMTSDGKTWRNTAQKLNEVHMAAIEKRALAVKQQLADQDNISKTGGDGKPFPHSVDIFLKKHFNDPSYTIQDVLEDTLASTFGAADTSTASISLTLYLLGLHPDKQAKLQKELDDAFGPGVSRDYTSEDLEKLPYLDACFKEALRLSAAVPMFGRELKEDLVIDGHVVPAGTTCMVNVYSLHRNKSLYPDPEKYLPERFIEKKVEEMHPFAFVAFSGGVRPCLGKRFGYAQAKVLMATVFSKYNVESTQPLEKLSLGYEVTLRAKEGLKVKFYKRNL